MGYQLAVTAQICFCGNWSTVPSSIFVPVLLVVGSLLKPFRGSLAPGDVGTDSIMYIYPIVC